MHEIFIRIFNITNTLSQGKTISKIDEEFIINIEPQLIDALNHIDYINEVLKNKQESQKANA